MPVKGIPQNYKRYNCMRNVALKRTKNDSKLSEDVGTADGAVGISSGNYPVKLVIVLSIRG